MNYFEKNFIKSKKYPLLSWNAFERVTYNVDLTTNAAKLFHLHFSSRFNQFHSGLNIFIEKLKETQSLDKQELNYTLCNPDINKNSKYKFKMEKIKSIINNHYGYCDTFYLEAISKVYNCKYD